MRLFVRVPLFSERLQGTKGMETSQCALFSGVVCVCYHNRTESPETRKHNRQRKLYFRVGKRLGNNRKKLIATGQPKNRIPNWLGISVFVYFSGYL